MSFIHKNNIVLLKFQILNCVKECYIPREVTYLILLYLGRWEMMNKIIITAFYNLFKRKNIDIICLKKFVIYQQFYTRRITTKKKKQNFFNSIVQWSIKIIFFLWLTRMIILIIFRSLICGWVFFKYFQIFCSLWK